MVGVYHTHPEIMSTASILPKVRVGLTCARINNRDIDLELLLKIQIHTKQGSLYHGTNLLGSDA